MSQCLRSLPVKFQPTSSAVSTVIQFPLVLNRQPKNISDTGDNCRKTSLSVSSSLPPPKFSHFNLLKTTVKTTTSARIDVDGIKNEQLSRICNLRNHALLMSQSQPKVKPENESYQAPKQPERKGSNLEGKPSPEDFLKVYKVLEETLPKLFIQPMNYRIYNDNVVFINNILNKTTVGLFKYVQQVALLRTVGHLKFAYVKFSVLNMSHDIKESRITVRWRIIGLSGLRVMLKFWKFKLWKWQEVMKQQETWYDGVSYFDVGSDGKIYRHIADKVMVDKDPVEDIKISKTPLAAKIAVVAALFPKPSNLGEGLGFQCSCDEPTTSTLSDLLFTSLL